MTGTSNLYTTEDIEIFNNVFGDPQIKDVALREEIFTVYYDQCRVIVGLSIFRIMTQLRRRLLDIIADYDLNETRR